MPDVGDVLQGKLDAYLLDEVLVDGRFGKTYCAVRTSDKEDVILKTILLDAPADWEVMEQFEHHADRLRQLDHPAIAPYLDAVVLQKTATGAELGLVQTFITTPSVKKWARGRGLIDVDTCLGWMENTLDALVYLHELREPVVHGDIDWGNILLGDDGSVKLVDFATVRQELLSAATLAGGMARGSLDFAPMEQLLGKAYPSSDLYALAMTLLAAIGKQLPEQFPTDGMRPDVSAILPYGTDEAIVSLLRQMTEPDPGNRLGSARIALERLRALRGKPSSYDADEDFDYRAPSSSSSLFGNGKEEESSRKHAPISALDKNNRDQILLDLMRSVTTLHGAIPDGDAWERLPDLERDRIHAFGIDAGGTHMVVAHKHDATIMGVQDLAIKGEVDFEELARRVAVSRDGKRIAILTGFEDLLFFDVNVSVWQRHHVVVEGMWPGNSQLTFSPDGTRVAISDDDQVNLYKWDDGNLVERFDVDGQFGLTFSPDGEFIFAVGDQYATTIPLDGRERVKLDIDGVTFSPDGVQVAYTEGSHVALGAYRELYPAITWAAGDATRVEIEDNPAAHLNVLRFSPNQSHLFVGSAEGFFRLIDTARAAVAPFTDWRCEDRHKVKIFEVGFSPDSSRLIIHGNLSPDNFHDDRMGSVLSWRVRGGEFLGAMLWLDYELSVMTARGFYGEVSEIGSSGFSSDDWERPEIAGELFLGRDAEKLLSAEERACLNEFHLRREHLIRAREASGSSFDLNEALSSLANLSHVALEVFRRADERAVSGSALDLAGVSRGMSEHLEDAAFDLDSDLSTSELTALHTQLLEESLNPTEPTSTPAPEQRDMEYDWSEQKERGAPTENTSRPPRKLAPAVTHRERDEPPPRLGSKPSDNSVYTEEAPFVEEEDDGSEFASIFQALVFATGLGFGVVYAIFYYLDQSMNPPLFWGLFLGLGPGLTLVFYATITKRIFGVS